MYRLKTSYLLNPLHLGTHIRLQPKKANAFCQIYDLSPILYECFHLPLH